MADSTAKPDADIYAAQKANIRDTAKWMATAYAAVAAVIVAGAPFAGLNALTGERLVVAILFGGVALASVLLAINDILSFLIGDYAFVSELPVDVRDFIDEHAADVLPPPFASYQAFRTYRAGLQSKLKASWDGLYHPDFKKKSPEDQKKLQAAHDVIIATYADCETTTAKLVGLAHLHILQRKLRDLRRRLAICTVIAVFSLAICVWTLPRGKADGGQSAIENALQMAWIVPR